MSGNDNKGPKDKALTGANKGANKSAKEDVVPKAENKGAKEDIVPNASNKGAKVPPLDVQKILKQLRGLDRLLLAQYTPIDTTAYHYTEIFGPRQLDVWMQAPENAGFKKQLLQFSGDLKKILPERIKLKTAEDKVKAQNKIAHDKVKALFEGIPVLEDKQQFDLPEALLPMNVVEEFGKNLDHEQGAEYLLEVLNGYVQFHLKELDARTKKHQKETTLAKAKKRAEVELLPILTVIMEFNSMLRVSSFKFNFIEEILLKHHQVFEEYAKKYPDLKFLREQFGDVLGNSVAQLNLLKEVLARFQHIYEEQMQSVRRKEKTPQRRERVAGEWFPKKVKTDPKQEAKQKIEMIGKMKLWEATNPKLVQLQKFIQDLVPYILHLENIASEEEMSSSDPNELNEILKKHKTTLTKYKVLNEFCADKNKAFDESFSNLTRLEFLKDVVAAVDKLKVNIKNGLIEENQKKLEKMADLSKMGEAAAKTMKEHLLKKAESMAEENPKVVELNKLIKDLDEAINFRVQKQALRVQPVTSKLPAVTAEALFSPREQFQDVLKDFLERGESDNSADKLKLLLQRDGTLAEFLDKNLGKLEALQIRYLQWVAENYLSQLENLFEEYSQVKQKLKDLSQFDSESLNLQGEAARLKHHFSQAEPYLELLEKRGFWSSIDRKQWEIWKEEAKWDEAVDLVKNRVHKVIVLLKHHFFQMEKAQAEAYVALLTKRGYWSSADRKQWEIWEKEAKWSEAVDFVKNRSHKVMALFDLDELRRESEELKNDNKKSADLQSRYATEGSSPSFQSKFKEALLTYEKHRELITKKRLSWLKKNNFLTQNQVEEIIKLELDVAAKIDLYLFVAKIFEEVSRDVEAHAMEQLKPVQMQVEKDKKEAEEAEKAEKAQMLERKEAEKEPEKATVLEKKTDRVVAAEEGSDRTLLFSDKGTKPKEALRSQSPQTSQAPKTPTQPGLESPSTPSDKPTHPQA